MTKKPVLSDRFFLYDPESWRLKENTIFAHIFISDTVYENKKQHSLF